MIEEIFEILIPSQSSKLTIKDKCDFFTMVEDNFEIHFFQMLEFDSKDKRFIHHGPGKVVDHPCRHRTHK